jgi:YVTN family beta-propeller protein
MFSLVILSCMLIFVNNNVDLTSSNVNSKTLDSIVSQTGLLEDRAHVDVGNIPIHLYGNPPWSNFIYVANYESNTVSVIDTTTNTVIKDIPVGNNPQYIYGDLSVSDVIYVANNGIRLITDNGTISVINTTTNTVIKDIPVGSYPEYIYGDLPRSDVLYVTNSGSDSVSVIDTTTNTVIKDIPVSEDPEYIYGHLSLSDVIYVTNSNFSTSFDVISVINTTTNTVIKDIPVGNNPSYIYGNVFGSGTIYVTNSGSDSVSVINTTTNTVIKDIPVGFYPQYIYGVGLYVDYIYVTNSESDSVSVIDTTTNTVIKDIPVADYPMYIYGDRFLDAIYVTNTRSAGVSVINSVTNELVAGITFGISPFGTGNIVCNEIDVPINRFLYVSSNSTCVAKPTKGFEFRSWVENLGGNSSRTISTSATSGSPWIALLDTLNFKSDDPAATFTINRFGNFTAYFGALPPAISSEYWIPLYGIIVSTVVGWSIPSIIAWRKSKGQISRLNYYHQEMASIYDDGRLDENDVNHLNTLNKNILNAYSEGKINNEHYKSLKNEISILYEEIYRKRIDLLKNSTVNREVIMDKIKGEIMDAYSKGKITELHYTLLNEKFLDDFKR